ncbi:MAG: DUF6544 family protein [Myxococcota bacterium]
MLRVVFGLLLLLHGLIHGLGVVKGFGLFPVTSLKAPIGSAAAILWTLGLLGFTAGGALLLGKSPMWWVPTLPALVASTVAIVPVFAEAKAGLVVNAVVLIPLALSLLELRPQSFRSTYQAAVARGQARLAGRTAPLVRAEELDGLPVPIQTFLRGAGVVGQPHVLSLSATMGGAFRRGRDEGWMSISAEQVSYFDAPTRIFRMDASLFGIPFEALHIFEAGHARMQVRVASLFEVVNAAGPKMDQSETVTYLNDLAVLAPAALLDAGITWEPVDETSAIAHYQGIAATLRIDAAGHLVDFVSSDRFQSADGIEYRSYPWSTPLSDPRRYGAVVLPEHGSAVWREPEGDLCYARFELRSIEYNRGLPGADYRLSRRNLRISSSEERAAWAAAAGVPPSHR